MARYRQLEYSDTATVNIAPAGAEVAGFAAQVLTPLCQSLISAGALGLLAGGACWAFIAPAFALPLAVGVAGVAFCGAWLMLLDDARSLLRSVNIMPGGSSSPPAPPRERLLLVNPPNVQQTARAQEAARRSRFADFVRACATDTSQRRLESLGYSRQEIAEWRDTLLRLRLAAWRSRDPRRGWELTASPDAIIARLA